MTRSRTWMLGTVGLVIAILAAGFFLLISPKRSQAAELKQQTVGQEATNAQLNQKISDLKVQQKGLPAQQAKLVDLRQQIPATPDLPTLIRSLNKAADATGVTLKTISPQNPTAVVAPAAAAPTTPGAAPANNAGLQQIPIKISVTGTYLELIQFLDQLESLKRVMLNTEFTVAVPTAKDLPPGTESLEISSAIYMVNETAAAAAAATQTVTPSGAEATPSASTAPSTDSATPAAPAQ